MCIHIWYGVSWKVPQRIRHTQFYQQTCGQQRKRSLHVLSWKQPAFETDLAQMGIRARGLGQQRGSQGCAGEWWQPMIYAAAAVLVLAASERIRMRRPRPRVIFWYEDEGRRQPRSVRIWARVLIGGHQHRLHYLYHHWHREMLFLCANVHAFYRIMI